jgi:hypothetical protein
VACSNGLFLGKFFKQVGDFVEVGRIADYFDLELEELEVCEVGRIADGFEPFQNLFVTDGRRGFDGVSGRPTGRTRPIAVFPIIKLNGVHKLSWAMASGDWNFLQRGVLRRRGGTLMGLL